MTFADPTTTSAVADALCRVMAPLHDTWMKEAERAVEPMIRRDATFWERLVAVNYLENRFLDRVQLDSAFLDELHLVHGPELSEQLTSKYQSDMRLHREVQTLSRQRPPFRQLARRIRDLLEARRLWYAGIELALAAYAGSAASYGGRWARGAAFRVRAT
jgi:hypothetical protein